MTGELLALGSALFYGAAGVAIARGRETGAGGNGILLSVILTAGLSGMIWMFWGHTGTENLTTQKGLWALVIFALAGVFSIVLGRISLYRSTELLGAVKASLLRRLMPLFAVPFAFVILGTVPDRWDVIGGMIVLAGILLFFRQDGKARQAMPGGYAWAIGSAATYAMSYCLRGLGLREIPDPALGTFVGALTGLIWLSTTAGFRGKTCQVRNSQHRRPDRWQWGAAMSLSIGQTLQFFALSTASVPVVAVLGTLEVIFAAGLAATLGRGGPQLTARLALSLGLAALGTALLVG